MNDTLRNMVGGCESCCPLVNPESEKRERERDRQCVFLQTAMTLGAF